MREGIATKAAVDDRPGAIGVAEGWREGERKMNAGQGGPRLGPALVVAVLGFSVVTLDAFVVNVALPAIGRDLGGGITGQQWVVDGYTLMFAALLLSAGALSDRIGARQSYGVGLAIFVVASAVGGLAPTIGVLVAARFVQGAGAAVMLPATLALIREGYADPVQRGRAIALWSLGAALATLSLRPRARVRQEAHQ